MKSFKSKSALYLIGILGVVLFLHSYPQVFTPEAIHMQFSNEEIKDIARNKMHLLGYSDTRIIETQFTVDTELLEYVEQTFPVSEKKQIYNNDVLPVYYWKIKFESSKNDSVQHPWKNIILSLDQKGELIGYWTQIAENATFEGITEQRAHQIAESIPDLPIKSGTTFTLINKNIKSTDKGYFNYEFEYKWNDPVINLPVFLNINIVGNIVENVEYHYKIPKSESSEMGTLTKAIPAIMLFICLIGLYLFTMIHKLRADGLSFMYVLPIALYMGIASAVSSMSTHLVIEVNGEEPSTRFLGIFISFIFITLSSLIALASCDSITREVWQKKLLTFDTLRNGRVIHRAFGKSILTGFSMGAFLLGAFWFSFYISSHFYQISFGNWARQVEFVNSSIPVLKLVLDISTNAMWFQFIVVLFLTSFLAKYLNRKIWIIVIVALVWALGFYENLPFPSSPFILQKIVWAIFGGVSAWIIYKYDFMAAFWTYFSFFAIPHALRLYNVGFWGQSYILMGLCGIIIVIGVLGLKQSMRNAELEKYTPTYVNQIIERERLHRELLIARQVQLDFLPSKSPNMNGLEIASTCIPALEVGGDYFDFFTVQNNPSKLGVTIGDVSGKGISAAFYMTLVKGFLRSLSKNIYSPKDVLIEMNKLFYENVDRGHFVSMIYGILDMEKYEFTFARAGHNPLLAFKNDNGKSQFICPKGLALGLEPGMHFDQIIEENYIQFQPEDVFLLYTDGLTEAMNSVHEEFGEQRVQQLFDQSHHKRVADIMQDIEYKVKKFAGKSIQHDDMSLVIIKISRSQ